MSVSRRFCAAFFLAIALVAAACSSRVLSAGPFQARLPGTTDGAGGAAIGAVAAQSFNKRISIQSFDSGLATVDPTPQWDGLGFVGVTKTKHLFAVQRRGAASIDQTGQLAMYEFSGPEQGWKIRGLYDSPWDDRGIGGGVSPKGTILVFIGRYEAITGRWEDMGFIRSTDDGRTFSPFRTLPVGRDRWFSPYGPLVALPSGRLMQTFYGTDGRVFRLRALFSNDDGKTWGGEVVIGKGGVGIGPLRPNEGAAVYLGGKTDATARLLLITRTDPIPGIVHGGLVQYTSSNGGKSWRNMGMIPFSSTASDVSPWLTRLSKGRVALVWAARGTMTIRVAVANASKVFSNKKAWGAPSQVYQSRLAEQRPMQAANFGYPTVADYGPGDDGKVVVFFDAGATDPSLFNERSMANTDLVMIRLLGTRCCRN